MQRRTIRLLALSKLRDVLRDHRGNGFAAMLDRIESNGVRMVIVDDASRFTRDLVAQELGVLVMQQRGVGVVTSGRDDLTNTPDPDRVMMRQVAGAFAQYKKARLVGKLKAIRDRKSAEAGKRVEGRECFKGHQPEIYDAPRTIQTEKPGATLRVLADELAARGFRSRTGQTFAANQVTRLLSRL